MNILSKPTATKEQLREWAKSKNNDKEFVDLVELYYDLSVDLGVNPVIAYAQFAHETGFLYKIKSAAGLDSSFHNPCGLKIMKGGGDFDKSAHKKFDSWNDGVSAHLDHLALYAGAKNFPKKNTHDPRHFSYLLGTARTVEDLSGRWAPSPSYSDKLKILIKEIENTPAQKETEKPSLWAEESWKEATDLRLLDGTRPKDFATRQEVASVAMKLFKIFYKNK